MGKNSVVAVAVAKCVIKLKYMQFLFYSRNNLKRKGEQQKYKKTKSLLNYLKLNTAPKLSHFELRNHEFFQFKLFNFILASIVCDKDKIHKIVKTKASVTFHGYFKISFITSFPSLIRACTGFKHEI